MQGMQCIHNLTHHLLAEDDRFRITYPSSYSKFQSTSSLRRTTCLDDVLQMAIKLFQSTSSLRRTTARRDSPLGGLGDFNPRPPCGGRLNLRGLVSAVEEFQSTSSLRRTTRSLLPFSASSIISIHVLLAEDDILLLSV